jgi:hypothetical protein
MFWILSTNELSLGNDSKQLGTYPNEKQKMASKIVASATESLSFTKYKLSPNKRSKFDKWRGKIELIKAYWISYVDPNILQAL